MPENKVTSIKAIQTTEGFIEITALEELDNIVGGLIDPEAVFCELEEEVIDSSL